MSILIKGMKMPKDCPMCPCAHWNKNDVMTGCEIVWRYIPDSETDYWQSDKRPGWCPLVEVPTPHGRLIDGEVLWDQLRYGHDVDLSELPETLAAFKKAEENPRCGTGEGGEVRPYRA